MSKSASTILMEPSKRSDDTCEKMTHTASLNSTLIPSTVVSVLPIKKKRKRRRRVNFSVMLVTDADKQNNRRLDIDPALLLRSGDIVIEICDLKVEGMTFKDACGVFSRESEKVNESLIQTKVIVARKKAIVAPVKSTSAENAVVSSPKKPVPLLSPPENTSMMFNPTETFTGKTSMIMSGSRTLPYFGWVPRYRILHSHTDRQLL
eukprot:CAMPEP_0170990090 /NCGR_PEP_ID=MMETSP0736-20130129/8314_1 /TAXON_ID=186038 /ORGANISM="Fragilariopsis kerguelensis, Strain L26-C5" /LENGTH=205 /DNA_ID=CAMNT_0011415037 /DNA_START=44 /DNA_END=661 /DNA_ORIENTATION=-